jgi:hypothetical protein
LIVNSPRGFPKDLTLEPRHCLHLYDAMVESTLAHPLGDSLSKKVQQAAPAVYFKVRLLFFPAMVGVGGRE